jgi:regulator of replication initiation timing
MELSNDISAVLKDLVMALLARVEALESENAALRAENADLRLENAGLRSRLRLNSRNSHKPPSSDGLPKKPGLPKRPQRSAALCAHPIFYLNTSQTFNERFPESD